MKWAGVAWKRLKHSSVSTLDCAGSASGCGQRWFLEVQGSSECCIKTHHVEETWLEGAVSFIRYCPRCWGIVPYGLMDPYGSIWILVIVVLGLMCPRMCSILSILTLCQTLLQGVKNVTTRPMVSLQHTCENLLYTLQTSRDNLRC